VGSVFAFHFAFWGLLILEQKTQHWLGLTLEQGCTVFSIWLTVTVATAVELLLSMSIARQLARLSAHHVILFQSLILVLSHRFFSVVQSWSKASQQS
jgi:hypothetical protein